MTLIAILIHTNSECIEKLVVLGLCDASFTSLHRCLLLLGLLLVLNGRFQLEGGCAVLKRSLRKVLGHICICGLFIRYIQFAEQFRAIQEEKKQEEA